MGPEQELNSPDEEVRLRAVLELAKSRDPLAAQLLARTAYTDASPVVRYHARKSIEGSSSVRRAAGLLPDVTSSTTPDSAESPEEWLLAQVSAGGRPLAIVASELVQRGDRQLRAKAAAGWLSLAADEAHSFVAALLDDPDDGLRATALELLANRDLPSTLKLLEARVSAARLAQSLRSLDWISEIDTEAARQAELRLFAKHGDSRLLDRLIRSLARQLPARELPTLLEIAATQPGKSQQAIEAARAIGAREGLAQPFFQELLSEYGLASQDQDTARGLPLARRRLRRLRKTVAAMALAVRKGTRALAVIDGRQLGGLLGLVAVVALAAQALFVWLPVYQAQQLLNRGLALYESGDLAGAASELSSALERDPGTVVALERLADIALDNGDRAAAREAVALVRAVSKGSIAHRRLSARIRLIEGDSAGAIRMLEALCGTPAAGVQCRLDLARAAAAAGRLEQARAELESALSGSPAHLGAALEQVRVLAKLKRLTESRDRLSRLLISHPSHLPARRLEGELALSARDYPAAVKAYSTVLERDSLEFPALLGLAAAQEGVPELASARATYVRLLEIAPASDEALLGLARVAAAQRNPAEARGRLRELIARKPKQTRAHFALALLELGQGDPASALAGFLRVSALAPSSPTPLYNAGLAAMKLAQPTRAAEFFRAAIALDPSEGRAWVGLGCAIQSSGHSRQALGFFERALEVDPLSIEAMINTAASSLWLGDGARARRMIDAAMKISPRHAALIANLSLLSP